MAGAATPKHHSSSTFSCDKHSVLLWLCVQMPHRHFTNMSVVFAYNMLDDVQYRLFLRDTITTDLTSELAAVRLMLSFVPTAMQQTHTPIYHNTPSGKTRNRRCTAVCLHILLQPSLTLDLQECHTTLHHCLLDFETTLSKPETHLGITLCLACFATN